MSLKVERPLSKSYSQPKPIVTAPQNQNWLNKTNVIVALSRLSTTKTPPALKRLTPLSCKAVSVSQAKQWTKRPYFAFMTAAGLVALIGLATFSGFRNSNVPVSKSPGCFSVPNSATSFESAFESVGVCVATGFSLLLILQPVRVGFAIPLIFLSKTFCRLFEIQHNSEVTISRVLRIPNHWDF